MSPRSTGALERRIQAVGQPLLRERPGRERQRRRRGGGAVENLPAGEVHRTPSQCDAVRRLAAQRAGAEGCVWIADTRELARRVLRRPEGEVRRNGVLFRYRGTSNPASDFSRRPITPAHAAPTGEVGDILPRHPPGSAAARLAPLDRLGAQLGVGDRDARRRRSSRGSSPRKSSWEQAWKPSQSPKRSESDTFSSTASRGVHPGLPLVLDHVARHQVPPVRGGVEHDVVRPALDPAVKNRLQATCSGCRPCRSERSSQNSRNRRSGARAAAPAAGRSTAGPRGAARSASAAGASARRLGVRRLDQARLAHAARAPEQHVVGRKAPGELPGVGEQRVARAVDRRREARSARARPAAPAPAGRARSCQTKASAAARSGAGCGGGLMRSSAAAIRASAAPVVAHSLPWPASASSSQRPCALSSASRFRSKKRTSRIEIS